MGAGAAAVILVKERHIVEAFERAGATTPAHALPLGDVPADPGGVAIGVLVVGAGVASTGLIALGR